MANYATLKAAIAAVIKENGNNEITGNLLQQSLLAMVDSLGVGYQYVGIASPATNPGTPDQNVFYLASTAGTYVNFSGLVLANGEIAILKYNGAWSKDSTGAASLEKLNQLGQELLGAERQYTRIANGNIENLDTPILIGETITSLAGVPQVLLHAEDESSTYVLATSLPFVAEKKYIKWSAYLAGSPQVTMDVINKGVIDTIEENIDTIEDTLNGAIINSPIKQEGKSITAPSGTITPSGALDIYTENIPIGTKRIYTKFNSYASPNAIGYAFYDANDNLLLCGPTLAGTDTLKNGVWLPVDVPDGATKFANSVAFVTAYGLVKFDYEGIKLDGLVGKVEELEEKVENNPTETNSPALTLPSKVFAVTGEKMLLFKNAFGNNIEIDKLHLTSPYCKDFPRYFEVNPTAAGEHTLQIDSLQEFGKSGSITLVVYNAPSNPLSKKNVLVVGSSTTSNYATQYEELYRRICLQSGETGNPSNPKGLGLTNIHFVGRLSNGQNFRFEATGGFSWANYANPQGENNNYAFIVNNPSLYNVGDIYTDGTYDFTITEISQGDGRVSAQCATQNAPISASGTLTLKSGSGASIFTYLSYTATITHPFDLGNGVSVKDYMDAYCEGENLDVIIFQDLIFNGGGILDVNVKNMIRGLLQSIVADYPNIKILLSSESLPSQKGGLGTNYYLGSALGSTIVMTNRLRTLVKDTRDFIAELNQEFGNEIVFFVPKTIECDADYDYPVGQESVNYRVTNEQENIGTNGMHPTTNGILNQIDAYYRSLAYIIKSFFN